MTTPLSPNTQATLLLTAPLITNGGAEPADTLTRSEYVQLSNTLAKANHTPALLLHSNEEDLPDEVAMLIDGDRIQKLLSRGLQLTQALEHWQSRAIWVLGRTDDGYPERLNDRLKDHSPPVLYGCGDPDLLNSGGLAVVGSRDVDATLIEFTERIGRLTAQVGRTLVSGAARGIDQAAMRGALEAGGQVIGVMADSLERAALNRAHRELLLDSKLVLISPYDPSAGFNVGHAMQRNKFIYALSDAAVVVNSDYEKGGTWAGAVEQIEKLRLVPIYVRSNGEIGKGLEALQRRGALPWPNPSTPQELNELLSQAIIDTHVSRSEQMSFLEH